MITLLNSPPASLFSEIFWPFCKLIPIAMPLNLRILDYRFECRHSINGGISKRCF
jgi:hypothetical protein